MNIHHQVSILSRIFEAVKVSSLHRGCSLTIWVVGQDGKGLWVKAAVEVPFTGLDAEEFILVDVIMEWRRND